MKKREFDAERFDELVKELIAKWDRLAEWNRQLVKEEERR